MNAKHTPYGRRYTVNEAAEVLGISAEAIRARINRGTLHKEKDTDGTVYVRMNSDHTHTNGRTNDTATTDHTVPESKAYELMQEQVDYLRRQLEVWQEEARRKDHIIAALTERIPELEPASEPRETPQAPETAPEDAERVDATADAGEVKKGVEPRSWWRWLFS